MKNYVFLKVGLILLFFLSAYAQGNPVVLDPNFYIEKFADVNFPYALEIPHPNSPFGNFLYVSSINVYDWGLPDPIFQIDLSTRELTTFFILPGESDPVWMVFGPGFPFTTDLYISSNNRDGGQSGDYGGSIVFLDPNPDVNGERFLTPKPPPTVLSEPAGIAFGPGGAFGTDLFVLNTSDPPYDIALISPTGTRHTFVNPPQVFWAIAFGPGEPFGNDLFVSGQNGTIFTVDPNGVFTSFVSIPNSYGGAIAFAPPGPFDGDMYVTTRVSGQVSIFRITASHLVTEFAKGFVGRGSGYPPTDGLTFSNDGKTLFVSDTLGNAIYRIAQPRGDMDNDYDVDFVDFALFAIHWLDTGCGPPNNWCSKADNTGDGKVDFEDLYGLAKNWLEGVDP